ncbi:MAG: xanthine dehydrogenase family protein subunit M [Gemmatimonadaceae bacterium]
MNISPEWPASNVPEMGEEGVGYQKGATVAELVTLVRSPGARPLAGGTDLLPSIRERVVGASVLVDLCGPSELEGLTWNADGSLLIGATTRLSTIENDDRVQQAFPALSSACAAVASPAIRNMGTIGGNLCQRPRCWYFRQRLPCHKHGGSFCFAHDGENEYHAIFGGGPCYIVHPSDAAVALMALDATVHVTSASGERRIPIDEFFVLPADRIDLEHVLQPGEIVRAVELPAHAAGGRQRFEKVMQREAWDFAVVSIAAARWPDDRVRLVLGGVAPIPWRIRSSIEEDVTSGALSADDIDTLAERAMYDAQPLAKNGYKVDIALALLRRAITELSATT